MDALGLRQRLRPAHWLLIDAVLATAYALFGYGVVAARIVPHSAGVAGTLLACAAVVAARRRPLVAMGGPLVLFWLSPWSDRFGWLAALPLAYTLYRVAERHSTRTAAIALAAGLTGPVATALPSFTHSGGVIPFALLLVASWSAGLAVRQRRQHTDGLLAQQAQLARAEVERARREVSDERIRIARELHDVVAHSMSVITVQAAFGRLVAERHPAKAAGALAVIETTGRETLAELRRVLDLLRGDEPTGAEPAPGLAALPRLIEQTAAAGVTVDVTIQGEETSLPAGLQLSAYRVVQEALTNVVKHAGVDRAWVTVAYHPDAVVLDVVDDGRGPGPIPSDGHGLIGMRERVALYGGVLQAGPRPERGFAVTARFPVPAVDALEMA